MALTWDTSMTTGIPRIDTQHRELIAQIKSLVEAMREGQGKSELGKMFGFLGEYVIKHFSDEEAEMERFKCPVAATNRIAHRQFAKKFSELQARFEQEGPTSAMVLEVQRALADWIVMHIKTVDTKLAACVASQNLAVAHNTP